jgi:serine/threonine-protein kinase
MNYKIIKQIGNGSYGTVYKVLNLKNNIFYAMKKIDRFSSSCDQEKILLKLNHKNIIKIYDFFYDGTKFNIIEELGSNDLYDYYSDDKNIITFENIYNILYDIAKALEYLHNINIVHGDIKIENILICDNIFKLCDFGMCSRTNSQTKPIDILAYGHVIEKLLLIYTISRRYYKKTFSKKYFYFVQLRDLCLETDYFKRITIHDIIQYLYSIKENFSI